MAALTQPKCSVCGAALSEPTDSPQTLCLACKTKSPDANSIPTAEAAVDSTRQATGMTVILGAPSDTQKDAGSYALTVDFTPSSDPTEPSSATLAAARADLKQRVGRFQVTSILGRGSFGNVYRAYDPLLDREVALKVPRFSDDDRFMMERFHREAKAAARLHHPNIVTLFEHGEADEGPYLVVEFVDGVPLSQMLREHNSDLRTLVDWVRQIAEGLHYAHSEGIVHRDVKPANIMMNRAGRPQIMDFGLAKRDADTQSGMTVEGQIVGTPNYMSPEQARGAIDEVGPHSDQYSVGVVLYEMICGRPPFVGDPWSIISRVASLRDNPPSPRSLKPDLPRDLEACCMKAMEKNPRERYGSLQAMADDLNRWLQGLPLLARPIGPLEQFVRWCRNNRLVAGLGGTVAILLLVAGIVGPWLAVRFNELAADEKSARLAIERSVIDSYTETGLAAHRNGDPGEAILWFANAAAASENYPTRERHNRIRMQSWLSQTALPVQAFAVPPAWKKSLSYHPSGHCLLSLSNDGVCELLEVSEGKRQAIPYAGAIAAATFNADGTRLVIASDRVVVVFDFSLRIPTSRGSNAVIPTLAFEFKEFDRWTHSDPVNCLTYSQDAEFLTIGGAQSLQVRDVSQKVFVTDRIELGSPATSIAMSADGRCCAVRTEDMRVQVFSCAADRRSSEPLLPAMKSASQANVPPMFVGNNRVVVVSDYESVRCWNIESKEMIWTHTPKRVLAAAVSPNGDRLAIGEEGDIVLLDADSGMPLDHRLEHPNLINSIVFCPNDSSLLLTGCVDHSARIFNVVYGLQEGLPIPHNDSVHRCVWSPDGATFATVHWAGDLIRIWKPSEQQSRESHGQSQPNALARGPFVRLNDRGDRWLPSSFDRARDRTKFLVGDMSTGGIVSPELSGPGLISDADFVPRSELIVLVGGGTSGDIHRALPNQKLETPGFVRFVNSQTGEPTFPDVSTPSQPIAVRVSPNGSTVVVLCHLGHLLLLDSATGKIQSEHQAFEGKPGVYGYVIRDRIRFSERGDRVVLWGCNALAELRTTSNGERIGTMQHESGFVHDAQFSPDGNLVATCGSDYAVRLWDSATGLSSGKPLAHSGWVFSAQFSRDGKSLLTASEDKHARIWDLATRTAILATREHGDQVFGIAYLPSEELFLASTRDGQITAWDATLGKMIAPPRQIPAMIYQLSHCGTGTQVVASGDSSAFCWIDTKHWILEPAAQLSRDDVRVLGELVSSQRIHESGAATSLTTAEWIERWNRFHTKHPNLTLTGE